MTTRAEEFVVTDVWLDYWRPPGTSWTQYLLVVLAPEAWPPGRRSPMAGWRAGLVGRVITEAQRVTFEARVRENLRWDVDHYAAQLDAAQHRLAAVAAAVPARAEWVSWHVAPGVM